MASETSIAAVKALLAEVLSLQEWLDANLSDVPVCVVLACYSRMRELRALIRLTEAGN